MAVAPAAMADIFQSTLSVRRATPSMPRCILVHGISIHALRKESDLTVWWTCGSASYFNPRSP